jgi:hypothetical protein
MINAIDDLVLLKTPIFLILISLVFLLLLLEKLFSCHGVMRIISLVLVLFVIVLSFFYDVKYQELVFVLLLMALAEIISIRLTMKKEDGK